MALSDISVFNSIRNDARQFLHDSAYYTVEQSADWFLKTAPEFYMLMLGDTPIGYFRTSNRTKDSIWIGLDIAPEYRGNGYAIPAYRLFMDMLKSQGIRTFYLRVLAINIIAEHVYKRLGFVLVSTEYNKNRGSMDILMQYKVDDEDYLHIYQNMTYNELEALNDSTYLVTGCNGFIGVWLLNFFVYLKFAHKFNIQVEAVDVQDKISDLIPQVALQDGMIRYHRLNIASDHDVKYEFTDSRIDYIFNCAGIAVPTEYMRKPIETLDVSYMGTRNIMELSREFNVKSVVCFSSSEVYGSPEDEAIPTVESHVGRIHTHSNRSCYDVGKLVLETLCYTYNNKFNVPVKVIRPFNLYGPMMNDTRVVPNMMRRILSGEPFRIYGDGLQTRTFCYMADAMVMILKVALNGRGGEIYNVGNSEPEVTMFGLHYELDRVLGTTSKLEQVPYPSNYPDNEPRRRCPNISKVVELTGYTPKVSLADGLGKTYQYFKDKTI